MQETRTSELVVLIFLSVKGMNNVYTCEILPCHTVYFIGELLNDTESRYTGRHNCKNEYTYHHNERRSHR